MQNSTPQNPPMTEDTKTIITVLLLVTVFPVGIITMWVWTSWKNSIKWLITILGCLPIIIFLGIMVVATFSAVDPSGLQNKAKENLERMEKIKEQQQLMLEQEKSAGTKSSPAAY